MPKIKKSEKKRPRRLHFFLLAAFMLFVAYKILTPPHDEIVRKESPDGSRSARLERIYLYDNEPSYRIDYRETGKRLWLNIYHLPVHTEDSKEEAAIVWSDDSMRLDFLMNGTSIWHHVFSANEQAPK